MERGTRHPDHTLRNGLAFGLVQQHRRASGSSALNPANALWNVALGLAAPLLNRNALDADVKIATTQQEAAVAAYAQAALTAFTDVENALSQRTNCERKRSLFAGAAGENREALRLMNIKYDVGQIDLLSVLQITQRLIASELGLIGIRNQRLAQRVSLHLALGESLKRNGFAANRVLGRPALQSKSSHLLLCPGHRDSDALTLIVILTIMTGSVLLRLN